MQIDHDGQKRYFTFESWDRFMRYVRETPRNPRVGHSAAHSEIFDAGATMAEAERLADIGWIEGAAMGREYLNRLVAQLEGEIERPTISYDVEGAALDIGRYLEGEPECWMKFEHERTPSPQAKFARFVVNVGASGGIRSAVMMKRAAVIIALVEMLESAGTRCEITVVDATGDARMMFDRIHYSCSITVKTFEQPCDLPLIAYAAGHPSVLRRHIFRLYETMDEAGCDAGYAAPTDVAPEHQGDLYFFRLHAGDPQWQSEEGALAWVFENLKKFGVALKSSVEGETKR